MKKFYSFFLLSIFITFLVADSTSHHFHDKIEKTGIVKYENFEDCDICLFSGVNSNSLSVYNVKPFNNLVGFKNLNIINESNNYTKLFNDQIFLRGPPEHLL